MGRRRRERLEREAAEADLLERLERAEARVGERDRSSEVDADRTVRAMQEADRRARELQAELADAAQARDSAEEIANIAIERADSYLKRIRELETSLLEEPAVGAAALWQVRAEQAAAQLAGERGRSKARGVALAALQESHRREKKASRSKDATIGRLSAERDEARAIVCRLEGVTVTPEDEEFVRQRISQAAIAMQSDALDRALQGERAALAQRDHLRRVVEALGRAADAGIRDLYGYEPSRQLPLVPETKEAYLQRRGWFHVGGVLDEWTRPSDRGTLDPDRVMGTENVYKIQSREDARAS